MRIKLNVLYIKSWEIIYLILYITNENNHLKMSDHFRVNCIFID